MAFNLSIPEFQLILIARQALLASSHHKNSSFAIAPTSTYDSELVAVKKKSLL